MVLLADKYRPKALKELDVHPKINQHLEQLVKDGNLPHLLLYGPSGGGKKTRVAALLRGLFGAGAAKTKVTHKTFSVNSRKIEIAVMGSNYHVELNPSDVGLRDTLVVQEVIKEIAQTQNVSSMSSLAKAFGGASSSSSSSTAPKTQFKVVVLTEVDRLSKGAQHALRRTMEKYMRTCRLILVAESATRVIGPLRSRVLPIRVPAPSATVVQRVLQSVADKEGLQLPQDLAARIAEDSRGNMRRALLALDSCKAEQFPLQPDQKVSKHDWVRYIEVMANNIVKEQSPTALLNARKQLYELLVNCIPPEVVLKELLRALLPQLDDTIKLDVVQWAALYESRMRQGSKPVFHLEAFVAKFMAVYKRWVLEMMG